MFNDLTLGDTPNLMGKGASHPMTLRSCGGRFNDFTQNLCSTDTFWSLLQMYDYHWKIMSCVIIGRVFFARAISPGQKWWWTLLGRELSCEWEGLGMESKCLDFFPFKFGGRKGGVGRGERIFFSFIPGSQLVPTRFPLCSPSSQCVPQKGLHSTSLLSHMLNKCCPPFSYIGGQKGRNPKLQTRTFYFGEPS